MRHTRYPRQAPTTSSAAAGSGWLTPAHPPVAAAAHARGAPPAAAPLRPARSRTLPAVLRYASPAPWDACWELVGGGLSGSSGQPGISAVHEPAAKFSLASGLQRLCRGGRRAEGPLQRRGQALPVTPPFERTPHRLVASPPRHSMSVARQATLAEDRAPPSNRPPIRPLGGADSVTCNHVLA